MTNSNTNVDSKTRPDQLMPTGSDAEKALQGFLHIMGFNPGRVDGDFAGTSKTAYDQARARYSFLPELTVNPDDVALTNVLRSIDKALQTDIAFQRQYINGIKSETNITELQGALVAGGSWANRHLGDRISEAEPIRIDGDRGVLTNRGVRNAITLTGVATLQSSLNLLTGSNLKPDGLLDSQTITVMDSYAQKKGIALTSDLQQNFSLVVKHIQDNEGNALHARIAEVLNADTNYSAPDARTLDAQIVMNGLARQQGLNVRTAPDSLQTDNLITAERSHTRTVIAPETGVSLTPQAPIPTTTPVHVAEAKTPFGLKDMYRVTRNDIVRDVKSITDLQQNNPEAPQFILAYSEKSRGFLLVSKNETEHQSAVYQISDRNVASIMSGINDGSIALDTSAQKYIAEQIHSDTEATKAYSTGELRAAFAEKPTRFTSDTRENLLTTSARTPDGQSFIFGLDDLHDGLNKMDSKYDWPTASDPIAIREYIKDLRRAAKDAREERPVTIPQWQGAPLNATNSVEINIGGQIAHVPSEIFQAVSDKMSITERGYSIGGEKSAILKIDAPANGLTQEFDRAKEPDRTTQSEPEADPVIAAEDSSSTAPKVTTAVLRR